MAVNLKKLDEQVIVITGASSGIGLTTARMAAELGARLVLASRNEEALRKLCDEINSSGTEKAVYVVADVGNEGDVKKIAAEAFNKFGGFDTWVNNAGVSVYGKFEEVPIEDMRQVFETNFWGLVHGSLVAATHLKVIGGALINVGSTLSDRSIPLQGIYCASKHAVKGFTEAFRMELEAEGAPISVTLIKPSAIDTPYVEHAKKHMDSEPVPPPPMLYAPETVAETILHCAENPVRDVFVGGAGKALSTLGNYAPRLTDHIMETNMAGQTGSGEPPDRSLEGLYEPRDSSLRERGEYDGHVSESSLYTKASLHPVLTGAAVALGAAGLAYGLYAVKNSRTF